MRKSKSPLSTTNTSERPSARYVGLVAIAAILFSIILPPFVGPASLLAAIQPSISRLLLGISSSEYPDVITLLSSIGFLLLIVGLLIGIVSFGFRYGVRKARFGMLACAAGLLLITVTLFDYGGDFVPRIFAVTQVGVWPSLEFYGTGYLISWIAVVAGLIATSQVFVVRRKQPQVAQQTAVTQRLRMQVPESILPTGYAALDNILYGGLPVGSSIVLTGPPCDEKNLIIRRFVETNLVSNHRCIYISTSIDRIRDLLSKHGKDLHVIICNPQSDTIAAPYPDVAKLKTVDNLTEINLEYDKATAKFGPGRSTVVCLEILDDVLLDHHGATRRWLMDILGRSKTNQMTCLATLNPAMHPAEESQAVLETFDGHIDLFEAEVQVRPKLIRVKKLGGRKFLDKELLVEREKI
jgi:KaiC/GvpD/RAD55 family RecA-like ATPase